ncbi:MAG: hypothetical protein IV090_11640 [Candidatus Sericytochromatia bacterium]|nr:hypothetical protein [Candidatus Sericytochromatia bacterium]
MKWIKSWVYLVLSGLAFHVFLTMNGLHWLDLWDLPSALMIIAGWLFTLVNYPLSEISKAFVQSTGMNQVDQAPNLSALILKSIGQNGLLAGGVCSLLGVVQALGNLDDMGALGAALAISFLGLLYALCFNFGVILPLQNALQRLIGTEY